jgi:hypothetical protein
MIISRIVQLFRRMGYLAEGSCDGAPKNFVPGAIEGTGAPRLEDKCGSTVASLATARIVAEMHRKYFRPPDLTRTNGSSKWR